METCLLCGNEIEEKFSLCKKCYEDVDGYFFYDNSIPKEKKAAEKMYKNLMHTANLTKTKKEQKEQFLIQALACAIKAGFMETRFKYNYKVCKDFNENKNSNSDAKTNSNQNNTELYKDFEDYRKKNPAEYRCNDGRYVRSLGEKVIADWLNNKGIQYVIEKMILYKDKKYHCDFYLKDFDLYIEHWGFYNNKWYKQYKDHKRQIVYPELGLKLIELEPDHLKNIDDTLEIIVSTNKRSS